MPSLQTNACAYIPSFGLRKPKSSASSPILAPAPSLSPPSGPPSVRKNLSMAASEYVPSFGPTSAPTHPAFAPRPAETEPQLSGNMKVGGDILLLPMSDFQFVFATLSWNVDLLRILLSRAHSPLLPQMTETAAIEKSEDAGQAPTTIQKERASSPLAANLVAQATTPTSNNSRCATSTVTWSQRLGRSQANGNTMTVKDTTCGADGCTTVGSASFNTTQCGAENVNPSSGAFAENYGTAAFPSLSEVLHMQPKRRGNVFHECSTRTCAATKEPGASFPNPSPVVSRAVTPQSFRSVVSPLTVPEGSSAVTLLPPCDGQPMTYAAVLRRALAAPQPASNAASLLTLQRIAAHPSVMSATASANTNASVRKGAVASVKTPMSTVQYHRRSRRHPHGVRSPSLSLTNDLPELRDVTAEDEGEEPPLLASSAASSYRLASTPSAFLMAVDAFPHSPTTAISSFPTSPVTGTDIGRPWSSVTPSSYGFGMQIGFPTGETVQALDNRLEASGRWSIPSPHTNGSESRRGSIQSALLAVPSSKQSRRRRARRRLHGRGPSFTIMVPSVTESPRAEYLFTAPNVDSEAALRLLSYVPAFPMQGHFPKDAHGGTNRSSTHPAQHRLLSQVYFQPWKLGSLLNRGDDADVVHWGSAYASKHPPLLGDADAEDDVVESVDALEDEETAHMVRRTQRGVAKLRNTDARARKERRRPQHGTGSVEPALGLPLSALWSKPDEAALKRLRDSRRQQKYGTEEGNESIMDGWVDGAWRSTTPSVSAGREGSFEIPAGAPTPEVVEFVSHSDESMSFFLQKFFRAALIVVIAQVDMNHGRVTQRSRDENGTALSASESAALGFVRQHMTAFRSMVNQFVMRTGTEVERRSAQPIFAESVSNGGSSPTPSLFSHPRLHQMLNAANVNEARGFYHASYGGSLPTGGPVGGPGELHPLWTDQLYLSGKDAAWQPLLMELLGVERVLQCYAENPSDSEAAGSTVDEGKLSGADRPMTANTGVMQLSSSSVPIHHTLLQALQKFLETTIAKEDAFLYHAERAERHGGVATGDLMALHQVMDHESTENAMFADYLAPHLRPPLPAGVGSTLKNPDPSHPHNDIATCCRGMLTPLEWKPYATYSDPVFGQATTHRRSPDITHVYAAILPLTGKMIIKWAIPSEDTSSYNLSVFFQPIIFNFLQGAPLPLFLDSKHANGPHQPLNPARSRMAAEPFRLTPAHCQEPQLPNMAAQPRRGSVLVHCSAGMHRSCGMVIAFLLWLESQCRGLPQYPFGNSDGVFSRPSLAAIIEGQFLHYQKSVFELAVAHVHQQRSMAEPIATVHYLLKEYSSHLLLP